MPSCYAVGAKKALIYRAYRTQNRGSKEKIPYPSKSAFYCATNLKQRSDEAIKQYLKAVLFNAPSTIDSYYTSLVAHDMASGALSGKPKYGDPDYYTYNEGESL